MVRWLLIAPIRFYRYAISPLLPPACRYTPSCSAYAMEAIEVWGVRGVWLARVGTRSAPKEFVVDDARDEELVRQVLVERRFREWAAEVLAKAVLRVPKAK